MLREKKKEACKCVISAVKHMFKVSNSNLLMNTDRLFAKTNVDPKDRWVGKNRVRVDSKYRTCH